MAQLVAGLASSHSPMLSTPVKQWHLHADRDRANPELLGADGKYHPFEELATDDPAIAREITPEKWAARYEATQRAITVLAEQLGASDPDVVVIVGDDQAELFLDDNMPALSIYSAPKMTNIHPPREKLSPGQLAAADGFWTQQPTEYPIEADLGRHLVEFLMRSGFDMANSRREKEGVGMSHAFTFVQRRIMLDRPIPIVPVMINTFYPPNTPSTKRCVEFGAMLGTAIRAWDSEKKVALAASGGLSHFVVDEDLDRTALDALAREDFKALGDIPESRLLSGNSELKNWAAAAAALQGMRMRLIDYVPVYRSMASTGCAMGFAFWS